MFPLLLGFVGFLLLLLLSVYFRWVGCRCGYRQLWGIGQYMLFFSAPFSDYCITSAVSHSFPSHSPGFSHSFLHRLYPRCCQLGWGTQVCTASQANIIKKKSFSVGVRWNHYLRFCALNVEGSTISKDFLPTQVHRSVCCPSCRLCCSTFKWGAQEIFVYVFFTAFTLLKFYFRGSSSAPCSIPPLTSPWPKMFFALSLIVLSWKFPVRHHGSFHVQ